MERLTTIEAGNVYFAKGKYPPTTLCAEMETYEIRECMVRLAEYEDTGLTPEEIKALKEFRDKNKGVEEYFETCVAKDKAIADCDYWKAEALKNCAKLGEIKLLVGRSNE